MCKKLLLLLLLLPFQLLSAQTKLLTDFPEGYTPEEVGKRLAYRFVGEKHALHAGKWIGYPETFYWNGALKYAAVTKDKELIKLLEDKFAPFVYIREGAAADYESCGFEYVRQPSTGYVPSDKG